MKQKHVDYQVVPYPKIRRIIAVMLRSLQRTPMIHGLIEVDVTRARAHLKEVLKWRVPMLRYAQAYNTFKRGKKMKLKALIGSGDKIGLFTLPFLIIGLILNLKKPSFFRVGGPPIFLKVISLLMLLPGVTIWVWSVILIVTKVPQKKLITNGPYSLVKHPLYTGVAFLVLPWIGFPLNTWLGVLIGITLYTGSRLFSPEEEALLSKTFGTAWDEYRQKVKIPWL